uniref:5'-nucleotidase n=1 Tax=Culicoides sonorensis TaxID=179676 RepID=A0A336L6M6_CULSO
MTILSATRCFCIKMLLFITINVILIGLSSSSVINAPDSIFFNENAEIIGMTAVDLDASPCMKEECNLGNLVADSIRYEYLVEHATNTEVPNVIVLVQGKNLKGMIEKGSNITRENLIGTMSKDGSLVKAKLTGAIIKDVLDKSVAKYNQKNGSPDFVQVAGAFIEFNFTMEAGKRLVSSKVLCVDCNGFIEMKDTEKYDIVMTEDLSKASFSNEQFTGLNTTEYSSLEKFIIKNQIVYPAVEGRITLHNVDDAPSSAVTMKMSVLLMGVVLIFHQFVSFVRS